MPLNWAGWKWQLLNSIPFLNYSGFFNILGICCSLQNDDLKGQEDMLQEIWKDA